MVSPQITALVLQFPTIHHMTLNCVIQLQSITIATIYDLQLMPFYNGQWCPHRIPPWYCNSYDIELTGNVIQLQSITIATIYV